MEELEDSVPKITHKVQDSDPSERSSELINKLTLRIEKLEKDIKVLSDIVIKNPYEPSDSEKEYGSLLKPVAKHDISGWN